MNREKRIFKGMTVSNLGDKVVHYFDKDGNELHEGDTVIYEDGREEKLYLTVNGELGTDATNRDWIKNGKASPGEYGVYPLTWSELKDISLKKD